METERDLSQLDEERQRVIDQYVDLRSKCKNANIDARNDPSSHVDHRGFVWRTEAVQRDGDTREKSQQR